ncbi:MAG TPA: GTPase domain-containing protein [Gemmataceae bacterium]|nr:GTPase domain-containing protein [Gemmataceae bacterium]
MPVPEPLRLVLFGPPGAGKSSLLGALVQAGAAQPQLLNGRIAEPSPELQELHRQVYAQGPPPAAQEIVPFTFRFEPERKEHATAAVVFDCDGRAAHALVHDPQTPDSPLAREISQADAVVLAVDASAAPEELDAVFGAFDGFLRRMEHRRGDRTEVGGLPIFLVLTKCDRLARAGETTADWLEHLEERKREVAARFKEFMAARDRPNEPPAFGRIHLHLWATAIRRPTLPGAAADSTDPYGVAELFRQSLRQAAAYRAQRERSARRLVQMTTVGVGAVVLLLGTAASLVLADVLHPPPGALEIQAQALRRSEPEQLAERLRGSPERLAAQREEWRDIRSDPAFSALPSDLRSYAEGRLSELDAYIPWLERLEEEPLPRDTLAVEDLQAIRKELAGLAPPLAGWEATDAGRLWRDLTDQAAALGRAVEDLQRWYDQAYDVGDALWSFSRFGAADGAKWNRWADQARLLLDPVRVEPSAVNPRDAALLWADGADGAAAAGPVSPWANAALGPGVLRRLFVPGVDPPMAQNDLQAFDAVAAARGRWEAAYGGVRRLLEAGMALGLVTPDPKDRRDLLAFPSRDPKKEQTPAYFRLLFRRVQEAFPDYETAFMRGETLPTAVSGDVRRTAKDIYDEVLEPARAEALQQLQQAPSGDPARPNAETPARWRLVRDWLKAPKELEDPEQPTKPAGWRGLALCLARLADPNAPDPVTELADFLAKDSFTIQMSSLTLVLGKDSAAIEPAHGKPLQLYFAPKDSADAPTVLSFPPSGAAGVNGMGELEYRFEAAEPDRKLVYSPGDFMYAELPLSDGRTLRWDQPRSRLYQFGALQESPVLLKGDRPGQRTETKGVKLHANPETGVPKIPDLMPQVDLK